MDQEKNRDNEVEQTLQSIDGISRAEVPGFFYTRLMARMEPQNPVIGKFFMRPVLSLVTLALLLVLNITVVTRYIKHNQKPADETAGIQSLAKEMSRDLSSVYNDKTIDE